MVITNLEEKENRKIWVPIRPGNRGGWSLFEWEKVREMPYRDREMYLGNSAKIGILDKGGKWRKKDWYLHKNDLEKGETLNSQMSEAMKRDQARMRAALGLDDSEEEEQKLTPAEMQMLLKKVRGGKQEPEKVETEAAGLGFDKMKVEIRARPNAKGENSHRLQGNIEEFQQKYAPRIKEQDKADQSRQRSRSREKKHKKHKKEKHSMRQREASQSEQRHKKKRRHRSRSGESKERKEKSRKEHRPHKESRERRHRHRSSSRQ